MDMTNHTRLDLVEGGSIFKQGEHAQLAFNPRDYSGKTVDLTGKDIAVAIWNSKGIMYEGTASFDSTAQLIRLTINQLLQHGDFQIEFTVTDAADPDYRRKFPSGEYEGKIYIKPSADNIDFIGVSMTTVAQLRTEQEQKQQQFELAIVPQVDELKQRVEEGIGAFTEDTEVLDARMGETNLRQFNEKTIALLADKANKGEIKSSDLDTSSDAVKIKPINVSDELMQMFSPAGTVNPVIANKGVTTEKGANGFIVDAHFSKSPIYSAGNKNLFDPTTATNGQGVSFSTGIVSSSPNDFVSDFLPIKPSTSYGVNKQGQLAFYDAAKTYISGSGNTNPLYQSLIITSPSNAYYVRISNPLSNKSSFQIEEGSAITSYEPHYKGGRLHDNSVGKGVIAEGVVEENNIERHTLADEALKYLPIETGRGKNLFNKNKVTDGVYIRFDTGAEVSNATYNATGYILVESNSEYTIYKKDQLSFYDENFNFISGIGGVADYLTLTTPATAKYLRMSVADSNLSNVQIERGMVSTLKEDYKDRIKVEELIGGGANYDALFDHLHDPFKKTKLKLVGDSITAGVSGTGYSLTGSFMFKDYRNVDRYENIPSATCWANSLKNFLEAKYSRETFVDLEHEGFEVIERNTVQTLSATSYNFYFYDFPNQQPGKPMAKFSFYGDHFSLYHNTHTTLGIFEIVVDGEVKATVDTYSTTTSFNIETIISGLSLDEHTVELRATKTKNASSTGFNIRFAGLKIPKTVEVRNWGISGIRTLDAYFDRTKLIESTDDIVFIQLGTNDRIPDTSVPKTTPARSKKLLEVVVNRAKEVGADVYLMAAPPASIASETNPVRAFHMEDVHNYIKRLADEQKLPFISHFQEFYEVIRYKGITLDSLLADGLHPNDAGYDHMFKKIMQETNIGLTYDGVPIE